MNVPIQGGRAVAESRPTGADPTGADPTATGADPTATGALSTSAAPRAAPSEGPVIMAGAPVAEAVEAQVRAGVAALATDGHSVGLGTILVGDDPASAGYVAKKQQACARAGMVAHHLHLPADATQAQVEAAIDAFNTDPRVDAFLVQNPLPPGLDFNRAMARVDPAKDADGLHPHNLGLLALGSPGPLPCTPAGIVALLAHYGVPTNARHLVIVGRGPTLGRPLSILMSLKHPGPNAAVTVVHSGVADWPRLTRQADVVVAGAGVPGIVTAEMVRPGAAVVGAGLSWAGRRVLSDLADDVAEVAGFVTPRLGGVGPTTVAMLLANALAAARRRVGAGTGA
ncbi:MAG: bifunctional 5,10-methylenetetrahydrofolate dehydrogenase/5,10-methenyltetrahydrofolate cyclohydrolase [Acidimicrobiales bacterium]